MNDKLLAQYEGPAECFVADCRSLPIENDSEDVVIVQGGLHHLPVVREDLKTVIQEARRILNPQGLLAIVEPWSTPFLKLVHTTCRSQTARSLWSKLDALHTMIENESESYQSWLQ